MISLGVRGNRGCRLGGVHPRGLLGAVLYVVVVVSLGCSEPMVAVDPDPTAEPIAVVQIRGGGDGAGRIFNPAGAMDCSVLRGLVWGRCVDRVDELLVLAADPAEGSVLVSWGWAACAPVEVTCRVQADTNVVVRPRFARVDPPPYSIEFYMETAADEYGVRLADLAAGEWERLITSDLEDVPGPLVGARCQDVTADFPDGVDDLAIVIHALEEGGNSGVATTCGIDRDSGLPIISQMWITYTPGGPERQDRTVLLIMHEIGHALGFGTRFRAAGLVEGSGGGNPRFVGRRAVAQWQEMSGTDEAGVPLEVGTEHHWRPGSVPSELMSDLLGGVSALTLEALADIGYDVAVR